MCRLDFAKTSHVSESRLLTSSSICMLEKRAKQYTIIDELKRLESYRIAFNNRLQSRNSVN